MPSERHPSQQQTTQERRTQIHPQRSRRLQQRYGHYLLSLLLIQVDASNNPRIVTIQLDAEEGSARDEAEAEGGKTDEDKSEGPGLMGMLAMYGSDDEEGEQNDSEE